MKKIITVGSLILFIFLIGFFFWRFYFVFGEGVKAGELNYFEKKGYMFKTWEGRLVQEGFQSPNPGSLQSNEFRFSVADDEVASQLDRASGKFVELRYKEYLSPIPWRGASNFVVTEVLQVGDSRRGPSERHPIE
ncbi:hypothetical protein [Pararhodonellum marinum]|uniref:hypothetical protein n=1 Tax=Pararhodonellum marinum TaxID=2755358 RepID=UPI00188E02F9|nr:hypothetical protein [Pararhodonellum marinum]